MSAVPTRGRWREPTSLLPLRWGRYRPRYGAAVVLIVAGGIVLQTGSAYASELIVLGFGAHIAGWIILPSRGAARALIALPSAVIVGSLILGAAAAVMLAAPLAFWLLLRKRPAKSYLATLLPVASGVVLAMLYPQYGHGAIVIGVSLASVVGAAWIARWIARGHSPARHRAGGGDSR